MPLGFKAWATKPYLPIHKRASQLNGITVLMLRIYYTKNQAEKGGIDVISVPFFHNEFYKVSDIRKPYTLHSMYILQKQHEVTQYVWKIRKAYLKAKFIAHQDM